MNPIPSLVLFNRYQSQSKRIVFCKVSRFPLFLSLNSFILFRKIKILKNFLADLDQV